MNALPACTYAHHCVSGATGGQKRATNPLELEFRRLRSPCGCWETNSGSLQKQQVL